MTWVLVLVMLSGALFIRSELGRIRSARALLGLMAAEREGGHERLYSVDGIVGRLIPELQWAALGDRRVTLVAIHWFTPIDDVGRCAETVAGVMRAHECVFRTGPREIALSLSAASDFELLHAVRRIMSMTMERCGMHVCDVGCARFPDDATDIDALFSVARGRMRPWQEWIDAAEQAPWPAKARS